MVTTEIAGILTKEFIEKYVNECKCETPRDAVNVLMKLTSLYGFGSDQPTIYYRIQKNRISNREKSLIFTILK